MSILRRQFIYLAAGTGLASVCSFINSSQALTAVAYQLYLVPQTTPLPNPGFAVTGDQALLGMFNGSRTPTTTTSAPFEWVMNTTGNTLSEYALSPFNPSGTANGQQVIPFATTYFTADSTITNSTVPFVLGPLTLNIQQSNVTPTTDIENVMLGFGTNADDTGPAMFIPAAVPTCRRKGAARSARAGASRWPTAGGRDRCP
jgi:hypothetical protein